MDIGNKIKELRTHKGLTQQELADRAELTTGFISQLERDLTSPSISTLIDILQCLGTTPGEFFNEKAPEQIVFKKEDYFIKENADLGNTIKWVVPNAQKNLMEPILCSLAPEGTTYIDNPHEGEEFGYVLKGRLKLHFGNRKYIVKAGETFYFKAEKVHFIEASKEGCTLLWVSTPPNF